MTDTTRDDYHGFVAGTRSTHLERPAGGLVCDTRLYKKDHASRVTVLRPDDLHTYVAYSNADAVCRVCADYAAATCTCADCVAAR